MTKWLYLLGAVALLALIASGIEGHRANQAEATKDSALAVGALHARQAEEALRAATLDSLRVDSLERVTARLRGRGDSLVAILHQPRPTLVLPQPTATDSSRYWRDSAGVAQEGYVQALGALQARSEEAQGLRGALAAEQAVAGHLRDALTEQTTRAEGLESALRKMPNACPKLLGIPRPRVGVGYGVTTKGLGPVVALVVPMGGC